MAEQQTERIRILELVAQGKLGVEEAETLLRALSHSIPAGEESAQPSPDKAPGRRPSRMRIQVNDLQTHQNRVNIVLPMGLVKAGIRLGAALKPWTWEAVAASDEAGASSRPSQEVMAHLGEDLEALLTLFDEGEIGPLVDVYDHEDGEHVLITLE